MTLRTITRTAGMSCLAIALALVVVACDPPCPDCHTHATAHAPAAPAAPAMPPEAGEYEVLGTLPHLKNFAVRYDDKLIRGGDPQAAEAGQTLANLGVTTIVSVTPTDLERKLVADAGMTLIEIPFEKSPGPSEADLSRFLAAVRGAPGTVYLHCHGGTHRGGILALAYRAHALNWPWDKALVEYGRLGGDLMGDHVMIEAVRKYTP